MRENNESAKNQESEIRMRELVSEIAQKREEMFKRKELETKRDIEESKKRYKEEKRLKEIEKEKDEEQKNYLNDIIAKRGNFIFESKKDKKKQKKEYKNPRKPFIFKRIDEQKQTEKVKDLLEVEEDAPKGIRKLGRGGLKSIFALFLLMRTECIPKMAGCWGTGDRIMTMAYLDDMDHFINNFNLVKRRCDTVSYNSKRFPYTGGKYLQYVWKFEEKDVFDKFINCFVNFKPATEIMWVNRFMQQSGYERYDNPSQTKMNFLTKCDKESIEKRKRFALKKFSTENLGLMTLNVVVGSIPSEKKRKGVARLIYTLNGEPDQLCGQLKLVLSYELFEGGINMGGCVEGENPELSEENDPEESDSDNDEEEDEIFFGFSFCIKKN